MSRPKRGVTLDNMFNVGRYFNRMIEYKLLFTYEYDKRGDATEAFKKIPGINQESQSKRAASEAIYRDALQAWVDKHVPAEKWHRCLATLRQRKFKKKRRLRKMDLHEDVYTTLRIYAEKLDISLGEAIYKAVKPQLDKIYDKEFAGKNGIENKKVTR